MAAFELVVAYLVAGAFKLGHDPAAARVNGEPPVLGAVRDEDARRTHLTGRCQEPWREGEHVREQVAVRYPDRQGVGAPVGVPSDCHARRINGAAREGMLERSVDGCDIRPVLPAAED